PSSSTAPAPLLLSTLSLHDALPIYLPPAGRFVGGYYIIRDIHIDADKVQGAADNLQILVREFRRVPAGFFQIVVGILSFEHHRQEGCILFAGCCLRGLDVVGRFNKWHASFHVLGRSDFGSLLAAGAYCLYRKTMRKDCMMAHLVKFARR